jgi:hypothetical protein
MDTLSSNTLSSNLGVDRASTDPTRAASDDAAVKRDETPWNAVAVKSPSSRAGAAEEIAANATAAALDASASSLTHQQMQAINLLLLGVGAELVAKRVGCSRTTLWRWRTHHPAFVARINQRRVELWGAAGDRLRAMLDEAVNVFAEQLRDDWEQTRFRAAKTLLTMAGAREMFSPARPRPTEPTDVIDQFARERRAAREVSEDERDAAKREMASRLQHDE